MLTVQKSTARAKINKKSFKLQVAIIASTSIFSSFSSAWGQAQPVATVNLRERECEPIAKVISGDIRWKALTKLCQEDKINPANGATVKVFCYPMGKFLEISGGTVGKSCLPVGQEQRRGCTLLDGLICINTKGPGGDDNAPILITPYGLAILNSRPTLSWSAAARATSYTVQVEGTEVKWSVEVQDTQMSYPKDQSGMRPGNVYTVNVIANQGDEILTASSSIRLLVPADEAQQVISTINDLQSLKESQDDLAIDMDAVYEAQNLVNESIEVLKARIKAGSRNPTIYRTLGDRYLIANLAEPAKQAYLTAKTLAENNNNTDELAKAQSGLKIAEQSQLPTRIKPAQ
jgi:hypothetical protein